MKSKSKLMLVRFLEDSIGEGTAGTGSGFKLMNTDQYYALVDRLDWEFKESQEGGYTFDVQVAPGEAVEYANVGEVLARINLTIISADESETLRVMFNLNDDDQFGAFPMPSDKYEN
jgi:hypothetical protein